MVSSIGQAKGRRDRGRRKKRGHTKKTVSKLSSSSIMMILPISDTSFSVSFTSPYTELLLCSLALLRIFKTSPSSVAEGTLLALLLVTRGKLLFVSSLLRRKGEIASKRSPTGKCRSRSLRNTRMMRRRTARFVRGRPRSSSAKWAFLVSVDID